MREPTPPYDCFVAAAAALGKAHQKRKSAALAQRKHRDNTAFAQAHEHARSAELAAALALLDAAARVADPLRRRAEELSQKGGAA